MEGIMAWTEMIFLLLINGLCDIYHIVHSVGQKSIGLKFSKSRTGSDVRYSCHHNSYVLCTFTF